MKKLLILFVLFPLVLWDCKSFDERTKFDVTYVNRATFNPENTNQESGMILSDTLILEFEQDLKDHDSRQSKVEYVRLRTFSLELDRNKSGDIDNMDFLKSVEFYQLGDQTEDLLIASTDTIPLGSGFFHLIIDFDRDKDLHDLVAKDVSNYKVVYKTRSRVTTTAVIKLAAKYEIDTRKWGI